MATKPKTTRSPVTKGLNRESLSNAKFNTAGKLMDKAFENGKPKAGTSVSSRISNKLAAWSRYEDSTKLLKEERRAKTSGARMGRAQAAAKAKRKK